MHISQISLLSDHSWRRRYVLQPDSESSEAVLKLLAEYPVQMDTGSSDLWIKGSSSPLPDSKQTVRFTICAHFLISLTASPQTTEYNITVNRIPSMYTSRIDPCYSMVSAGRMDLYLMRLWNLLGMPTIPLIHPCPDLQIPG